MELSDSSLMFWKELQHYGWNCTPDFTIDALIVKVDNYCFAAYILKNFSSVLKSWATSFGLSSTIIKYGEGIWDFLDVEACVSPDCIFKHKSTRNPFLQRQQVLSMPNSMQVLEDILGLDYIRFQEKIIQYTSLGLIACAVSNITNVCLHTNPNLEQGRAIWSPTQFIGYNYLEFWRQTLPQLETLQQILARDKHVFGYEYEGIRPDGSRCRYSTDFYLIDYMGEPTRFGISRS
jgi:hypothetical protein